MSKDTISVNMNVYDIPILVEQLKKLEQENKQLKNILTKLEEWVKNDKEYFETTYYMGRAVNMYNLLDKIQELKEKYK